MKPRRREATVKGEGTGIRRKDLCAYTSEGDIRLGALCLNYTVLFFLCSLLAFLPYLILDRSFVYRIDGASQYIVYLRYMGQHLKEWAGQIARGNFLPVMYDFTIGMGDDVNAIIRFHPLDFLSLFVPSQWTEYLYDAILLIRYYLSGLSFCLFAFLWKNAGTREQNKLPYPISQAGILSGSMIYVFCGYMLLRVMNHPTYASPFIILPLLLIAVERLLKGKGYVLFPAVVFLGFVSNYYFMYICSVALLLYVLLRLPDYLRDCAREEKSRLRAFFSLLIRAALLYLLGLCMSLVTLLPTILRYASSYRTSQTAHRQNLLYYADLRRYVAWIPNLITPFVSSGNGTNLNYAVTVAPALFLLVFFCRGKLRTMKRVLALELVFLLIPAGGYILAGFNNENNRWMFLISLALGMCVVFLMDAFSCLDRARQRALVLFGVFFLLLLGGIAAATSWKIYAAAAGLELIVCIAVLIVLNRRGAAIKTVRGVVLLITCVSVIGNAWMTFLPGYGNMASHSTKSGQSYRRYIRGIGSTVKQLDQEGFYRVDSSAVKSGSENAGIYYGYRGVSMYNSILNTELIHAMLDEGNIGLDSVTHLQDMDGRFLAESLAGVKYYVTDKPGNRPYGFSEEPVLTTDSYYVYENAYALPFAYSYDHYILKEEYEKLDPVSRELVQLHAAVVDASEGPIPQALTPISGAAEEILTEEVPLPDRQEGMIRTENGYKVETKRSVLTLSYEKKPGYVCVLQLKGLRGNEKARLIRVSSGLADKKFNLRGAENTYTLGKEDYLISLMAESEAVKAGETGQIEITFFRPGQYSLDSVQMLYLPVKRYGEGIAGLSEEAMTKPEFTANRISGTISLSREKLVTFQVLSKKGWKLYIDGEEKDLIRSNVCYLGAYIPEGVHEVLLVYETPGLRMGAAVSLAAFVIWLALIVSGLRGKKRCGAQSGADGIREQNSPGPDLDR